MPSSLKMILKLMTWHTHIPCNLKCALSSFGGARKSSGVRDGKSGFYGKLAKKGVFEGLSEFYNFHATYTHCIYLNLVSMKFEASRV